MTLPKLLLTSRSSRVSRSPVVACFAVVIALGLSTMACASQASTPRMRVARDLGCTADRTAVQTLGEGRWQVSGCGRTAVYLCTTPVRDCWREGQVATAPAALPEDFQQSP